MAAGLEALHDGVHALHFVQRHADLGVVEVQQAAQVHRVTALVGGGSGVLLKGVIIAGPAGLLQQVDGLRVVQVLLGSGAAAELVGAKAGQLTVDVQAQGVKGFADGGLPGRSEYRGWLMPPTRETVLVKYLSTTSWLRPSASKIWLPA